VGQPAPFRPNQKGLMTGMDTLLYRTAGAGTSAALLVIGLAACGDTPTDPTVDFEVIEEVTFADTLGIDLAQMTRLSSGMYIQDLVVGDSTLVAVGDYLDVAYSGWLKDGTRFDSGTFSFLLGGGQVIQGFDQGVIGMRVGGKRKLVIPPALGYGSRDMGIIPPGSILVFDVEILGIQ